MKWKNVVPLVVINCCLLCYTTIDKVFRSTKKQKNYNIMETDVKQHHEEYIDPPEIRALFLKQEKENSSNNNIQMTRKHQVLKVCEKYPELGEKARYSTKAMTHILTDEKHNVLYSMIPKIASTTWLRTMIVLSGKHTTKEPFDQINIERKILRKYGLLYAEYISQEEVDKRVDNYYAFMFSRDPYER